jgi:hypothetical protein
MIDVASSSNRVLLAVSSGPTITGTSSFSFYQFQMDAVGATPNSDTEGFADYPTLGVDRNALNIGVSVFNSAGTALIGTTIYVINKASLLIGTLTLTAFRQIGAVNGTGPGIFTAQGVDNDDPASTEGYFVGVDNQVFSTLDIRRVISPGGVPSLSANMALTVPTTTFPLDVPHPGGIGNSLDAIDDRLFAATIHRNKVAGTSGLWTAHNIQVNSSGVGSSSGGMDGSRWYEIANMTSTPTLVQSGTLYDASGTPLTDPTHFTMNITVAAGATSGSRSVTVTNPDGQTAASATGVLTIGGTCPATPVITAPTGVAPGATGQVASAVAHAGSSYFWSITNGSITAGQNTNQITFTAGASGTVVLSVVETSSSGCASPQASALVPIVVATRFYTLAPCRVFDTRHTTGPDAGAPSLSPGEIRAVAVAGKCGVPASARALSLNLAVTGPTAAGSLSLYRADLTSPPLASNINFQAAQTRANNAIVSVAADGTGIKVMNGSPGTVDLILDVNGYFQ